MGLFNRGITGNILYDNAKKVGKKIRNQNRKRIEDGADKIHPVCGKVVRAMNNLDDTISNAQDSLENGIIRKFFASNETNLTIGDHLFVQRIGYTHHGLYVGNGKVVHYLAKNVQEDSLETFADGAKIHIKSESDSPIKYSRDEVINRAYSRYGEDKYNLLINNCESFVRWCRSGGEENY